MKMKMAVLQQCPLFSGIQDDLVPLLGCLGARTETYPKDGFIFRAQQPALFMGIVLAGGANVIQEDFWGNRTILTHASPGELFGEAFSCATEQIMPVSVTATQATEIMLLDYRKVVTTCPSSCAFHTRLIANMLRILADKNMMLTRKMEHISQRTTREKLLSFLSAQALRAGGSEVALPFNRQELADYLCVERSALSRELGRMKVDGLLEYDKNRFRLL